MHHLKLFFELVILALTIFCWSTLEVLGQWKQTSGPVGGDVLALGSSGNRLYAGTYAGVFLSIDSGKTWRDTNKGLQNLLVKSITVCQSMIILGTYDGVFLSMDQGDNWIQRNASIRGFVVTNVVVKDSLLFASTYFGGVVKSNDTGKTWIAVNSGLTNPYINTIVAVDSVLLAGSDGGGVFRSTNNGTTWTPSNDGLLYYGVLSFEIHGSTIFCGTGNGIYRSDNGGMSWTKSWPDNLYADIQCIKVVGQALFAGTSYGVYISNDNGDTWNRNSTGIDWDPVRAIASYGPITVIGTVKGGLFRSTNGGVLWQASNHGLVNTYVRSIVQHDGFLFAATDVGIHRSSDNGNGWTPVNNGLSSLDVYSLFSNGSTLYAGTNDFAVFYSIDDGSSWSPVYNGTSGQIVFTFTQQAGTLFKGTTEGVFRLVNNEWIWSNSGISNYAVPIRALFSAYGLLFAGSENFGMFSSADSGKTWKSIYSNGSTVFSILLHGTSLFASTNNGVIRSTDHGTTWDSRGGIPWGSYSMASTASLLFAASYYGGVYMLDDTASNWKQVSLGLPPSDVWVLSTGGEYLYSSPYSCGVWRRSIEELRGITVDTLRTPIPEAYILYQNYPNPFNPTTTISFSLPHPTFVTVRIFNVLGQEVVQLVSEQKDAGVHKVLFRGNGLASGVYFYRLQASDFVQTRKLLLLR